MRHYPKDVTVNDIKQIREDSDRPTSIKDASAFQNQDNAMML